MWLDIWEWTQNKRNLPYVNQVWKMTGPIDYKPTSVLAE